MSFHFSFVARTVSDAHAKLAQQHAPGAVKAVIESALDSMPLPQPSQARQLTIGVDAKVGSSSNGASAGPSWETGFFGVSVEASGHIGGGYASISKLEVRPLVA